MRSRKRREREKERERGRRVEAGRALNNRFNWVMHEEVTYAKGPNLAARDLLLPAALPTRSGHSPSLLLSLSPLSFASSSVRSTLMTRTGIYSAQTVALNQSRLPLYSKSFHNEAHCPFGLSLLKRTLCQTCVPFQLICLSMSIFILLEQRLLM